MRGEAISSNNFYFVIASTTIIVPCVAHFIVRFATQLVSKSPSFIIWSLSIFILLNPSGVLKTSFHFFSPGCTRSYPHSAPTGLFEKNYSRTIKSFHISQGCALQSPSLRGVWGGPAFICQYPVSPDPVFPSWPPDHPTYYRGQYDPAQTD